MRDIIVLAFLAILLGALASCGGQGAGEGGQPVTAGVNPASGGRGTAIEISGTGFETGAVPVFDGKPCLSTEIVSPQKIRCRVPALPPGESQLMVMNPGATPPIVIGKFNYRAYVFVANGSADSVSSFSVDSASGALSSVGEYKAGPETSALALSPEGDFLFAVSAGTHTLSSFKIDPANGSLASTDAPVTTAVQSSPAAPLIHPNGQVMYVAMSATDQLAAFSINRSTGSLNQLDGASVSTGDYPISSIISPDGKFLYCLNRDSNNISAYFIDAHGALTAVPGAPFAAGTWPSSGVIDPSGRYLYVTNSGANTVSEFSIDSAGALKEMKTTFVTAATSLAMDPLAGLLFVTDTLKHQIHVLARDISTGQISHTVSKVSTGEYPNAIAADASGRFLYTVNLSGSNVSAFALDRANGELKEVPGSPVASGKYPLAIVVD